MRLLTYNIWNYSGSWRRRRDLLLDIFRQHAPDVLLLQEVRHNWNDLPGHNQVRWFAERLGLHWLYRPAHTHWLFPPLVEGLAVLSRREPDAAAFYRLPSVPASGPRRVILHARIGYVDLYDVHYPLSEEARLAETRALIRIVRKTAHGPALVAGDFNAGPRQPPMRELFEAGFHDLWTELGPGPEAWPCRRRIDYVLGLGNRWTGSIKTVGAQPDAHGVYPSDHVGILADLGSE